MRPSEQTDTRALYPTVTLKGPFHEGDVFRIPFKMLGSPIAREEPHGYSHYVVLRKIGRKKYRLKGTWQNNPKGNGVVRELEIQIPGTVEVQETHPPKDGEL